SPDTALIIYPIHGTMRAKHLSTKLPGTHYVKLSNTIFPLALFLSANAFASGDLMNSMQGDLGLFANVSSSPIKGVGNSGTLLPYAYFDYGRVFTRIDTFGVKTVPVGYGYLELVGRIQLDGYQTAGIAELKGINDRQN